MLREETDFNFNESLADAAHLGDCSSVIDTIPYTDGLGFSAKLEYPERIAQKLLQKHEQKVFGFLRFSVYNPKYSDKKKPLVFIELSAAKYPERESSSSVVVMHHYEYRVPMSLSEVGLLSFEGSEIFLEIGAERKRQAITEVLSSLWSDHLCSVYPRHTPFLRLQELVLRFLTHRHRLFLSILEWFVWISSGASYIDKKSLEPDSNAAECTFDYPISKRMEGESVSAWLKRVNWFLSLEPTNKPSEPFEWIPKISGEKINFHGVAVSPISVFWFYCFVASFFLYRFVTDGVGEVEFLNAYTKAIIFFAPITVLTLSWGVPVLGGKMMNYCFMKYIRALEQDGKPRSLKRIFGQLYLSPSSQLQYESNDYF